MKLLQNIYNRINAYNSSYFVAILCIFFVTYQTLLSLQGFDMCDSGYVMFNYQNIFKNPDCVAGFCYYNALLLGGFWQLFFGNWGYFGFLIFGIIIRLFLFLFLYTLLKPYANNFALLLGFIFFNHLYTYSMVGSHNILTAMFVALSLCLLSVGVIKTNYRYILLGGIVVGFNVFCRWPNVTMLGFGLLFVQHYSINRNSKVFLKFVVYALLGFLIGLIIDVLFIYVFNHQQYVSDAIDSLNKAAITSDNTHNLNTLLNTYLDNYWQVTKGCLLLSLFYCAFYFIKYVIHNSKLQNIAYFILTFVSVFFICFRYGMDVYLMYSFSTMVLVVTYLNGRKDLVVSILSLGSLIVLFFLPLGSDVGIGNMGKTALLVAFPIMAYLLVDYMLSIPSSLKKSTLLLFSFIFISSYISARVLGTISMSDSPDIGSRFKKTYNIENSLVNVYTSQEKAESMNALLHELHKYVNDGDYILCFQSLPTIHYMTRTLPYLNNCWPWCFSTEAIEDAFTQASIAHPNLLPVVVKEKGYLPGSSWHISNPDYNNVTNVDSFHYKKGRIIAVNNYLEKNNYEMAWENDAFQLFLVRN